MGIKYFFSWLKTNFNSNIKSYKFSKELSKSDFPLIDILMFDMNGIIHNVCAEVFEYGPYKKDNVLVTKKTLTYEEKEIKVFEKICEYIDFLIKNIKPRHKVLLCIDGVAPRSKQNQQRSRRFRSAKEKTDLEFENFDSNCISPGTSFMENLGKYIDKFIYKNIGREWNFEVIFSNDKVPGEAEHKLIHFTRELSIEDRKKSFMVHGMDADLIMLTLGTMIEDIYILRENTSLYNTYFLIDIGKIRNDLANKMNWNEEELEENPFEMPKFIFDSKNSIYDFIAMCFTVGNDFLPQIPTIEIHDGGIEIMFNIYKSVCRDLGHLTEMKPDGIFFNKKVLKKFFENIREQEEEIIKTKINKKDYYIDEKELSKFTTKLSNGDFSVNYQKYKTRYNLKIGDDMQIKKACMKYLEGMQWVLTYYIDGVKEWNWIYNYHYAPFATDIVNFVDEFDLNIVKNVTHPCNPFFQLLRILPSKSKKLVPQPLQKIFQGNLKEYYPEEFKIDLEGKKKEWEGIVIIPFIDDFKLYKDYLKYIKELSETDLKRNRGGHNFVYRIK